MHLRGIGTHNSRSTIQRVLMDNSYILLRIDPLIWQDQSLTYPEKILLNLVFQFTAEGKCCELTDEWIANKFGMEIQFVGQMVSMLMLRGWINVSPQTIHQPRKLSINIPGFKNPCEDYIEII